MTHNQSKSKSSPPQFTGGYKDDHDIRYTHICLAFNNKLNPLTESNVSPSWLVLTWYFGTPTQTKISVFSQNDKYNVRWKCVS